MNRGLSKRLEKILPIITEPTFLSGDGIGNEIACYIFDYPASEELTVRAHVEWMVERLANRHSNLDVLHLDLFDIVINYLDQRGLVEKTLEMESARGISVMLNALKGPLAPEKVVDFLASEHQLAQRDLLLMSGVGRVWPMLRAHSVLSCLHPIIENVPVVMFYPGRFDGSTLRLFGQIDTTVSGLGIKSYYRAFILVPSKEE